MYPKFHPTFFLKTEKKRTAPYSSVTNSLRMGFSIVSRFPPIPKIAEALNALAEGTAALRRLSSFLALEEAASPRPPMSEDKELPLLLAPGDGGDELGGGLTHKFYDQNKGVGRRHHFVGDSFLWETHF